MDVFRDEQGRVGVGVHFGSRGLGHPIASGFLALSSGATWGEKVAVTEVLLDFGTPLGEACWTAMELAGRLSNAMDWRRLQHDCTFWRLLPSPTAGY